MEKFGNYIRYIVFLPVAILCSLLSSWLLITIGLKILPYIDKSWSFMLYLEIDYRFIGELIRNIPMYALFIGSGILSGYIYAISGLFVAPENKNVPIYFLIIACLIFNLMSIVNFFSDDWNNYHSAISSIIGILANVLVAIGYLKASLKTTSINNL